MKLGSKRPTTQSGFCGDELLKNPTCSEIQENVANERLGTDKTKRTATTLS